MSAQVYDSNVLAPAERPSTEALNRGFSADHARLDWFTRQFAGQRVDAGNDRATLRNGFTGAGYQVRAALPATMLVTIDPGIGYLYDPTSPLVVAQDTIVGVYQGVTDLSPYRPLVLPQQVQFAVPPLVAVGQSRYDIIEVRPKRELAEYGPLLRFDTATLNWAPTSAAAFLRYAVESTDIDYAAAIGASVAPISYVRGIPAVTGTQVEPAGTPGYIKIARVLVNDGDTTIPQNRILDYRTVAGENGTIEIAGTFDLKTTGPDITPTIIDLIAPPGVRVAIVGQGGGDASFALCVMCGKEPRSFSPVVTPHRGLSLSGNPLCTWGYNISKTGEVGVTIAQTLLANPLKTAPPLEVANGQFFASVRFQTASWNQVTQQFDEPVPDPTRYTFHVLMVV